MAGYKSQKGFLMIEVVIAIVIISLALVAAATMFVQSSRANSAANDYTTATSLAQKQIELLKSHKVTGPTANFWAAVADGASLPWEGEENHPIVLNNTTYTVSTVAHNAPEDPAGLVQVSVTVSWNRSGQNNSVTFTAFFSRYLTP